MTLAIVWRSNRLSLVDISDMNNIKNLTDGVTLPGNPVCVSVVATSKGWTAYCGQSSGYVSAVTITNTEMTRIRDVQLPGISSDVWLDLSVDNSFVYAVASTGPQRAKMFSVSTSDFDVVEGDTLATASASIFQLGSVNVLNTPLVTSGLVVAILIWSVETDPPSFLDSQPFSIPFTGGPQNMGKSLNGSNESLLYIANPSSKVITGIRSTNKKYFNKLPDMTLPGNPTAIAPVSYDGKAYVSAGSNLCVVNKDKGVSKVIPLANSANAISLPTNSSAAYLLLNNQPANQPIFKVDFSNNDKITKGILPWLNPLGLTVLPPKTPQAKPPSNCGCM